MKKTNRFGNMIMYYLVDNNLVKSKFCYFNATKGSKCVSFFFDNKEYNLYIKYSKTFDRDKRGDRKCSFQFTYNELNKIKWYTSENNNVYIAFICTTKNLRGTEVIFISVNNVLKILGSDIVNTTKNIYIKHIKSKQHFKVWGTMLDEIDALKIKKGFDRICKSEKQKLIA